MENKELIRKLTYSVELYPGFFVFPIIDPLDANEADDLDITVFGYDEDDCCLLLPSSKFSALNDCNLL